MSATFSRDLIILLFISLETLRSSLHTACLRALARAVKKVCGDVRRLRRLLRRGRTRGRRGARARSRGVVLAPVRRSIATLRRFAVVPRPFVARVRRTPRPRRRPRVPARDGPGES